jgi:RNA polymerase sigma-70 factor (ECF subfamily)
MDPMDATHNATDTSSANRPVALGPDVDEAVSACYLQHAAAVERYVRSLVRDPDEAGDISQEVFLRLLIAGRAGRMPEAPMAWMIRVAHNLVVSRARRRQTADRTLARLADRDSHLSTEDAILRRERDEAIVDALAGARGDDRTAMILAAQGYRATEIGRQLGRTELATRTLLCRARGRLKLRLAEAAGA